MLSAEDLWDAWKRNFTAWLDSHYKLTWEMSSEEWTRGVVEPYLLHLAREKMGLWIRFAQENREGALIFDADASTAVAHIEHENERDDISERISALAGSAPKLKCIITYGDPKGGDPAVNRAENKELMEAWNESVMKPAILRILTLNPDQQWLLIFGLEYDFRKEEDWMAYLYANEGGKTSIYELD